MVSARSRRCWLKQESDNYHELGEPKDPEDMWIKPPQDRKKLYDWLKFYHGYIILSKDKPAESARSSNE